MGKVTLMTKEGLDKLKTELNLLRTQGRKDIADKIAEARDKGDLSENAEYDAAKDEQGLLEMKIAKLEELVGNARVFDESQIDTSKVSIMCTVKIRETQSKKEMTFMLVSEEEADLKKGKISIQSPIGSGLIGKKIGDVAEVRAPKGSMKYEILDISLNLEAI